MPCWTQTLWLCQIPCLTQTPSPMQSETPSLKPCLKPCL
jgi:hypothetical protein